MTDRLQRLLYALAVAPVALAVAACCSPGATSGLAVTLHPQETSMWCWAASGEMVMDFLGTSPAQCTQANNRFNRTDCPCNQCGPNPQVSPPCVNGGWPEFDKYGLSFERTSDSALSWDSLKRELAQESNCGRRPVAYSWHWAGGGGHMMVASGYQTVEGTNFVAIRDPWAPCNGDVRIITYAAYVSGSNYTHWDDFYRIR